ncbi:MAG: hypothetical protein ACRCS4_09750 [Flavobacterium sp.]
MIFLITLIAKIQSTKLAMRGESTKNTNEFAEERRADISILLFQNFIDLKATSY